MPNWRFSEVCVWFDFFVNDENFLIWFFDLDGGFWLINFSLLDNCCKNDVFICKDWIVAVKRLRVGLFRIVVNCFAKELGADTWEPVKLLRDGYQDVQNPLRSLINRWKLTSMQVVATGEGVDVPTMKPPAMLSEL